MKHKSVTSIFLSIFIFLLMFQGSMLARITSVSASPAWPYSWILVDTDKNENGAGDDMRDVKYAYYQYDEDYIYFRFTCYALPGSEWSHGGARYKWFIDHDGDMFFSGGNIFNGEYLLFVEDTDYNGVGEIFLLYETNNDGSFGEYEPWPPANYANYKITDPNIGGFRIVGPYAIEMYVSWASIGTPSSYQLFWATDQQNPNLDQGPTTDRADEEVPIAVHNVAATSQTAFPTTVQQGEDVAIQVVVENKGTLAETFNVTCYFNNSAIYTQLAANLDAAHQTTLHFNWDTTGIPEGIYTITAWADSSAAITETDETDNWCTYPATVTIQSAPAHDVAAVSQVPDKIGVVQGAIVNINVTLSNFGDFAETFNVTCFYSNTPIGYSTLTSMPKETSTNIVFAWNTSGVTPGLYYIRAMADSSHAITEIDENNNNCTSLEVVSVYSSSQMGKLAVDKAKESVVSGEDPPVVGQTTIYELKMIVTNIGGSTLSNVKVNETISPDVSFVSAGSPSQGFIVSLPPPRLVWNVGTLVSGGIATVAFRISSTPSALSPIYLNHKEDLRASGTDVLGNPVNATGTTDIIVQPIIRDVSATSQIPSSTIVCQGETVSIQVTVNNYGNVSETFNVACDYDYIQIGVMRVYNLEAGQSAVVPFSWDTTGISPGAYSIKAKADSSGEIAESNETNNICTYPSIVEIVIHDVAVPSQTPSPMILTQGETLTVQVIVKNEGTEPETFNVSCYINETFIEKKSVTILQPNETRAVTFLYVTAGTPVGIYFINAYASVIPGETDTSDNACRSAVSVEITSPPVSPYVLTIITTSGGTTSPWPGSYNYSSGSIVQVMAIPTSGYVLSWWEFDGANVSSSINPVTITMNMSHTIKAVFSLVPPVLSVSIDPFSSSILLGQSVIFTSTVSGGTPPYSYQWFVDGLPELGATATSWAFTPSTVGIYYVYLRVTDASNSTAQSATSKVFVRSVPVGGYSFSWARPAASTLMLCYATLLALLGVAMALTRRKRK